MIKVYTDLNQIMTLESAFNKDGRKLLPSDLSIIDNASIAFDDKTILWVGESSKLPEEFKNSITHSLKDHVLIPEIVESHTHVVFGGDRADEYAQRLNGVSYEEIAKKGGGILKTMSQTNGSTLEHLFEDACQRIERIHSYGIGTIEIKSGYGLNFDKEFELSLLIDRLKKKYAPKVQIFNTYLAAHDVPKTFQSSSQYINEVVIPLLEKLAPLKVIDAVDIFHEKNYFNDADVLLLFDRARHLGIQRKIHADELNDNSGAALACASGALSADHLLKVSASGIMALSTSKTVATLLPGTAFFLGKPLAPARLLLDGGAKVAIGSDYNPGSCHCDNLLLIACLSAAQLKINQAELWAAITLNAAHALGLNNQGALISGMKPRFSLFKCSSLSHITYNWGRNFAVSPMGLLVVTMNELIQSLQNKIIQRAAMVYKSNPLSENVIKAFYAVPRHLFVSRYRITIRSPWIFITEDNLHEHLPVLYADSPLAIYGSDEDFENPSSNGMISTISQPSFVLRMLDLLKLKTGMKVFEIGAGSGWNAALIGHLVGPSGRVESLEIIPDLIALAQASVEQTGLKNVHIILGDGGFGEASHAPYDRAIFTAGSYDLPTVFYDQMKNRSLLLFVLKHKGEGDTLLLLEKKDDHFESIYSLDCGFVPMTEKYQMPESGISDVSSFLKVHEIGEENVEESPVYDGWHKDIGSFEDSPLRSFLSLCEDNYQEVNESNGLTFGIFLKEEKSACFILNSRFVCFGSLRAKIYLSEIIGKWARLGRPSREQLVVKVHPAKRVLQVNPDGWLIKRNESQFEWSLKID